MTAVSQAPELRHPVLSAGPPAGHPGIPFLRLVRVESRKIVDTRSGRWLLIVIGVLTAAALGVIIGVVDDPEALAFGPLVEVTSLVQLLLYPVLGILATTAEFAQRTGLVTFTVEPRRTRVVLAKLLAAAGWAIAGLLVAIALAAVAHLLAVGLRDVPLDWSMRWAMLGGFTLAQLISVAQGVAFGLLLTSPAAAIVAYFVLPTILQVLSGLVRSIERWAPWVDIGTGTEELTSGAMSGGDWAHLSSATAVWVLAPLVIGAVILTRREIK